MLFYLSCFGLKEGVKCTWHALINCSVCTWGVVSTARELLSIVIVLRWTVRTSRYAFFCCRLSLPIRVKGTVRCQFKSSRVDANTCLDARDHPDALANVKLDSWIVCVAREEHVSRLLSASGWWVICMWVRSLCWALHVRTACIAICKVVSKE